MDTALWDGVGKAESFKDSHVEVRNRLADDARDYRWSAVFATLDDEPELVNAVRPGVASGYTALHQAAHANAQIDVVHELIRRGAWRTFRNGTGERPCDIGARLGHEGLLSVLEPVYLRQVPTGVLLRLQSHLHAVIRQRAANLVDEHGMRLPELEVLLELAPPNSGSRYRACTEASPCDSTATATQHD